MDKEAINVRNCIFGFKCDKRWGEMIETSQRDVKFCDSCQKEVYLISDEYELMEAIELNRCVAIFQPSYIRDPRDHELLGVIENYKKD